MAAVGVSRFSRCEKLMARRFGVEPSLMVIEDALGEAVIGVGESLPDVV